MNNIKQVITFTFILIFLAACGKNSDESLYQTAKSNIDEGKFAEAIEDFKRIINEYPKSNYTAASKFELGKLYQGHVLPRIPREESIKEAINYYSQINTEYPDSVEAVSSLFMIAFLEANEIGNLDKARETYEEFLKRYPNHELAISARAELNNLGKTPEEILQEKFSKSE